MKFPFPAGPLRWVAAVIGLALMAASADAAANNLRIATTGDYPPFSYVDDAGKLGGFDVDIALALCERMGVECELRHHEWETLIPELRAGTFDVIAASMSITEPRRELVAFTDRYYSNVARFVANKDSDFHPDRPAGTTIGVARATVSSDWLEDNVADVATIKLYRSQSELLGDLAGARLDAVLGDGLGLYSWLQSADGAAFRYVGHGLRLDEGIGLAVRREDDALRRDLNRALAEILADGTYSAINGRYFPFSIY